MSNKTVALIKGIVVLLLSALGYLVFPQQFIKSNEIADNPKACPYYITLQSLIANYPLLAFDQSNKKFIRSRLIQFENDIKKAGTYVKPYEDGYLKALSSYGMNSIKMAGSDLILPLAMELAPLVDRFYLNENTACFNPLYTWEQERNRRILQYNLSPLYANLPERYWRILGATKQSYQLGIFSGFFVNNQSTTLGTEFMTGMPLLTAIYTLPFYDFDKIGSYSSPVPWSFFKASHFIQPMYRKILDISGIDVFTVDERELQGRQIPGTKIHEHRLLPEFSDAKHLKTFINTQSYGMAFLANHIQHSNSKIDEQFAADIKDYFAKPTNHSPLKFKAATYYFYQHLLNLKHKHDIVLPGKKFSDETQDARPAGEVKINGIVAERASFTTDCLRGNCFFVTNIADAPGWHLFVDGKETQIERANFAFIAAEIPHGQAEIWLVYQPWHRLFSYFLSISTLMFFFAYALRKKFNH